MKELLALWSKEPAIIVGFVTAILVLLTTFGINISDDQRTAIIGVIAAALVLIGSVVTRSQVSSPATTAALIAQIPGGQASVDLKAALDKTA